MALRNSVLKLVHVCRTQVARLRPRLAHPKRGQGTVEYLLLTSVIVAGIAVLKLALIGPMNEILATYSGDMSGKASTGGRPLQSYYQAPGAQIK